MILSHVLDVSIATVAAIDKSKLVCSITHTMTCSYIPDEPLAAYRSLFKEMIREDCPDVLNNRSRDHALVIVQELISSAEESVHILCSKLSRDIYGDSKTMQAIEQALSKGVEFYVYIRTPYPESEECHRLLKTYQANVKTEYQPKENVNDFCVVDKKRYRKEINQTQGEAIVCANDTIESTKLISFII